MKLTCILFGHDDPVMDMATGSYKDYSNEKLFKAWATTERSCRKCGKSLNKIL